ncbi:39S ribosomal protein L35, mitochondrial [Scaptodrosophila lebanonensis]|uniref:Large ribosomal subunit protein bL35m n=1 Tax=Drosophila lebanonensis TaxID=7225 RepID=A0A6J2T346_DROLE|nr:39S ribosomal protein L35, mitochondrial [Scaptodrosophila lebanonensis]
MLRTLITGALRSVCRTTPALQLPHRASFSQLISSRSLELKSTLLPATSLTPKAMLIQLPTLVPSRNVTKFSLIKGKRKTVKAVLKRFKRLDWGAWIRTHSGRNKKLFKKSSALKRRLRQHVFTNATQSWLLDKMVTSYWRRPKPYINDPYAPYHRRDEYFATKSKVFKV